MGHARTMPRSRRSVQYARDAPWLPLRRADAAQAIRVTVGAPRWAMQGTLGLADGLPMVIHAR